MCVANPKVSVIIPVYNGQKTIARCIDSVLNQTFKDLEVIVINDGSTDDTINILKKYEADERLLLITQENSGVSVARNVGIKKATGEWITFVDADDYLELDCLEIVIQNNNIDKFELIFWNYYRVKPSGKEGIKVSSQLKGEYRKEDALPYVFDNMGQQGLSSVYCRLFLKELIVSNMISFEEGLVSNEDRLFMVDYLLHAKHILGLPKYLYNRTLNRNSIMHCWHQNAKKENLKAANILKERLIYNGIWNICQEAYYIWILQESITQYLETYICHSHNIAPHGERKKELHEFINEKVIAEALTKIKYRNLPMKSRIKLFIVKHEWIFILDKWYRNKDYFE